MIPTWCLFSITFFHEGWVQNQLSICLLGLLNCLRRVCCYYSVASFCSSFYSTLVETKGVNFCRFVRKVNQAWTKYSANCIQQFPCDPHTWRVRIFTRSPFCFLIHRKSPLLIKSPNHQKKSYDHTANKLGCPRPGLTTSIIIIIRSLFILGW